jgi:cytochrome bd-type quinol oxidase subunit 2
MHTLRMHLESLNSSDMLILLLCILASLIFMMISVYYRHKNDSDNRPAVKVTAVIGVFFALITLMSIEGLFFY